MVCMSTVASAFGQIQVLMSDVCAMIEAVQDAVPSVRASVSARQRVPGPPPTTAAMKGSSEQTPPRQQQATGRHADMSQPQPPWLERTPPQQHGCSGATQQQGQPLWLQDAIGWHVRAPGPLWSEPAGRAQMPTGAAEVQAPQPPWRARAPPPPSEATCSHQGLVALQTESAGAVAGKSEYFHVIIPDVVKSKIANDDVDPATLLRYKQIFADNGGSKANVCRILGLDASKWAEGGETAFLHRYLDLQQREPFMKNGQYNWQERRVSDGTKNAMPAGTSKAVDGHKGASASRAAKSNKVGGSSDSNHRVHASARASEWKHGRPTSSRDKQRSFTRSSNGSVASNVENMSSCGKDETKDFQGQGMEVVQGQRRVRGEDSRHRRQCCDGDGTDVERRGDAGEGRSHRGDDASGKGWRATKGSSSASRLAERNSGGQAVNGREPRDRASAKPKKKSWTPKLTAISEGVSAADERGAVEKSTWMPKLGVVGEKNQGAIGEQIRASKIDAIDEHDIAPAAGGDDKNDVMQHDIESSRAEESMTGDSVSRGEALRPREEVIASTGDAMSATSVEEQARAVEQQSEEQERLRREAAAAEGRCQSEEQERLQREVAGAEACRQSEEAVRRYEEHFRQLEADREEAIRRTEAAEQQRAEKAAARQEEQSARKAAREAQEADDIARRRQQREDDAAAAADAKKAAAAKKTAEAAKATEAKKQHEQELRNEARRKAAEEKAAAEAKAAARTATEEKKARVAEAKAADRVAEKASRGLSCPAHRSSGSAREVEEPEVLIPSVFHADEVSSTRVKKKDKKKGRNQESTGTCTSFCPAPGVWGTQPSQSSVDIIEVTEAEEQEFIQATDKALAEHGVLSTDPSLDSVLQTMGWSQTQIEKMTSWRDQRIAEGTRQNEERQRRKLAEQAIEDEEFRQNVHRCTTSELEILIKQETQWRDENDKTQQMLIAEEELRGRVATEQEKDDRAEYENVIEDSAAKCARDSKSLTDKEARAGDGGEPVQLLGIGLADADEAAGAQGAVRRR